MNYFNTMNTYIFLKKLSIDEESLATMLISEESLKKDGDNKYDERWNKY